MKIIIEKLFAFLSVIGIFTSLYIFFIWVYMLNVLALAGMMDVGNVDGISYLLRDNVEAKFFDALLVITNYNMRVLYIPFLSFCAAWFALFVYINIFHYFDKKTWLTLKAFEHQLSVLREFDG